MSHTNKDNCPHLCTHYLCLYLACVRFWLQSQHALIHLIFFFSKYIYIFKHKPPAKGPNENELSLNLNCKIICLTLREGVMGNVCELAVGEKRWGWGWGLGRMKSKESPNCGKVFISSSIYFQTTNDE